MTGQQWRKRTDDAGRGGTGGKRHHRHAHVRFVGCGLVSARRVQCHRRRVERRRQRAARERYVRGQRRVVEAPVPARAARPRFKFRAKARARRLERSRTGDRYPSCCGTNRRPEAATSPPSSDAALHSHRTWAAWPDPSADGATRSGAPRRRPGARNRASVVQRAVRRPWGARASPRRSLDPLRQFVWGLDSLRLTQTLFAAGLDAATTPCGRS